MATKPEIPNTPTKHVDFLPDLKTIEAKIAEGAVWLDHRAPVTDGPERTGFVASLKGLKRYMIGVKGYFSIDEVSEASGRAFNLLDNLLEATEWCVECPDYCLGQIKDGDQWRLNGFRKPLRDIIVALTPGPPTYDRTVYSFPTSAPSLAAVEGGCADVKDDRRVKGPGDAEQQESVSAESNGEIADASWPIVADVERMTAINRGTISRAADAGELKSNGKKGRARRIDPQGLVDWVKKRISRGEPSESAEHVAALVRNHVRD